MQALEKIKQQGAFLKEIFREEARKKNQEIAALIMKKTPGNLTLEENWSSFASDTDAWRAVVESTKILEGQRTTRF